MGWVSQKAWGRMVGVGTIEGGGIMGVASASGAGGWGGELIAISAGGRLGGETHGNKYVREGRLGKHRNKRGRGGWYRHLTGKTREGEGEALGCLFNRISIQSDFYSIGCLFNRISIHSDFCSI